MPIQLHLARINFAAVAGKLLLFLLICPSMPQALFGRQTACPSLEESPAMSAQAQM
jgi:hypothetical protein